MTDNLPDRLRKLATYHEGQIDYGAATMLLADAADEIERLNTANAQLREAVEALAAELRKEAAEMRQPEGGVIREIADKFCSLLTPRRRKWRDHPDRNNT